MQHLIDKAESYAREFHIESMGWKNKADEKAHELYEALKAHSQAVGRSSVCAYREGRSGAPASPNYTEWEREAWESGRNDR